MADRLDVAERLAEGRPAVEHTQSYVRACHALGYQHPDLTSHPTQVRDWYDSEDGLDLHALDRDCAQLRAAGEAVSEALRMQRAQLAELAAAWAGPGGDAAVRSLQRHVDAANTVATEVRAAAQRCESLRDNLWYLVDSKVATAIAIDDRTQAQRQAWLAAAAAVTTGVGDRPGAEEVIRQQVNPHVDNEIRNDWLTTMRSTLDGVATSYAMVTDRMAAAPAPCFELPGDLAPGYQPLPPTVPSAPAPAAAVPPAGLPSPPADPAPAPAPTAAAPAPAPTIPAPPPPDPGTALGDAAAIPAGDVGGGLGGLGGLANRIVDAMGSLLGSAADQVGTEGAFDDEDPFHADDGHDVAEDKRDEPEEVKEVDETPDTEEAPDTQEATPAEEARPVGAAPPADAPPVDAPPAPIDAPAPVPAAPIAGPAPPANDGSTPCEIAADQLPQAGQ
ncbi:hypothetical protein K3U93_04765 [Mycobacterium malmoense]|uniref:Uncharacterized protein n=1 Tax=Mycobacterium malmoense TaxID=1780 RepID=A0ABX3SYN9_MYCMA|nr:hypothetical protein [Mycobacterium malmoense]OIN79753.1 hypothetical protein BMG05_16530 [Mycobacterium malmoense]ORA85194.1 hypothetical protein BST29_03140 [Mycobacterium malmoense]QZA18512.1 hypothetical protein K3U93_04765 [Mycobacterium malmoense]UNB95283.1 hypothetical protein H5T25_04755 [Mycobacterium malmoense]